MRAPNARSFTSRLSVAESRGFTCRAVGGRPGVPVADCYLCHFYVTGIGFWFLAARPTTTALGELKAGTTRLADL